MTTFDGGIFVPVVEGANTATTDYVQQYFTSNTYAQVAFVGNTYATATYVSNNYLSSATVPVGGGTDKVFYEGDQNVTSDYTITTNKNAMSAGPITIDSGVTVTVPAGSVWTIV